MLKSFLDSFSFVFVEFQPRLNGVIGFKATCLVNTITAFNNAITHSESEFLENETRKKYAMRNQRGPYYQTYFWAEPPKIIGHLGEA